MTVGELIEYLKGEKPDAQVMIFDRIETNVPKQISEVHTLRNIKRVFLESETREEDFRQMKEEIKDFQTRIQGGNHDSDIQNSSDNTGIHHSSDDGVCVQ